MLLISGGSVFAQFQFNGSAASIGGNCYQLTALVANENGSMWDASTINLNDGFYLNVDMFFGSADPGGSGMAFVLQPNNTSAIGTGGGMGLPGLTPSFSVEFDTETDAADNDPVGGEDHLSIQVDGNLDHNAANNLLGPVDISSSAINVEDGTNHNVIFTWDPGTQVFEIYVDCVLRLSYTGDIITNVFSGVPNVFWGFTGSTGAAFNIQRVCINYASMVDGMAGDTICRGDGVQLDAGLGNAYSWSPAAGLTSTNVQMPIASPTSTEVFTVTVTDACNLTRVDSTQVLVDTVGFSLNAVNDAQCEGQCNGTAVYTPASNGYLWSDGFTGNVNVNLCAGTHTITITGSGPLSCPTTTQITINEPAAITLDTVTGDTSVCFGQSTTLTATGTGGTGGTPLFEWRQNGSTAVLSTGAVFITPPLATATTYIVTARDSNFNCPTASYVITVTVNDPLMLDLDSLIGVCKNEIAILQANVTGGEMPYAFNWTALTPGNPPAGTANPLQVVLDSTTRYAITVNDNCGSLQVTDTIEVRVDSVVASELLVDVFPDSIACPDETITLSMTNFNNTYTYDINFGDGTFAQNVGADGVEHAYQNPGCYD
ncbi:MAG: L-type lectin-domain containing protein, partial [Bacteroidota bacterium]